MKSAFSFARMACCAAAAALLGVASQFPRQAIAFGPVAPTRHHRPRSMAKGREKIELRVATGMNDAKLKAPKRKAKKAANGPKKRRRARGENATTSTRSPRRKGGTGGRKNSAPKTFRPLKDLKLGSKLSGRVVDVCDFGVFVSIDYATRGSRPGTALLHISQIRDEKIDDIHDFFKVGDAISDARVINVDFKKGEVGLSLRERRPKRRDFAEIRAGESLKGRVASVVSYGAFVDVGASVNALLHISRITGGVIENIRHHLNEGDSVSVRIIDINVEKKTMAASMLDTKADRYHDRRMSQRLKRFYGSASDDPAARGGGEVGDGDYFDKAIRELEDALRG